MLLPLATSAQESILQLSDGFTAEKVAEGPNFPTSLACGVVKIDKSLTQKGKPHQQVAGTGAIWKVSMSEEGAAMSGND